MPSFFREVLLGELADAFVEALAHDQKFLSLLGGDVDVGQNLSRDGFQGVVGPLAEPVDGAAVDEGWELSEPFPERLADG